MKADLSLPGWGGWFALPPTAGGGRAAILPRMEFVVLRLAERRIGTLVHNTTTFPRISSGQRADAAGCPENICSDWFECIGFPPFVSETLNCGMGTSDSRNESI